MVNNSVRLAYSTGASLPPPPPLLESHKQLVAMVSHTPIHGHFTLGGGGGHGEVSLHSLAKGKDIRED